VSPATLAVLTHVWIALAGVLRQSLRRGDAARPRSGESEHPRIREIEDGAMARRERHAGSHTVLTGTSREPETANEP